MYATHCTLATIKQKIFHLLPLPSKPHLEKAIALSEQYDTVWNSIYWNTSNAATKKRVRSKLQAIAYQCYSEMINFAEACNNYAHNQSSNEPGYWKYLLSVTASAFEYIEREHSHQIYCVQLELPLYENIPNTVRRNSQCDSNLAGNTKPRSERKAQKMAA